MEGPQLVPLGEGLALTHLERGEEQLRLHITSTSRICPLCPRDAQRGVTSSQLA